MTIHSDGMMYRVPYTTENRDTLRPTHDHSAYIRGWCDLLDGVDRGYYINDNPYSKHYNYSRHKSWEAGRDDAWNYLNT